MPKQRGSGELVQGTLEMLILRTLARGAMHGYAIAVAIESRSEDILRVEEGSLYPALHRLELAGLLTSEWREEAKRNKRFYRLSPDGEALLAQLLGEWNAISESILRLTQRTR